MSKRLRNTKKVNYDDKVDRFGVNELEGGPVEVPVRDDDSEDSDFQQLQSAVEGTREGEGEEEEEEEEEEELPPRKRTRLGDTGHLQHSRRRALIPTGGRGPNHLNVSVFDPLQRRSATGFVRKRPPQYLLGPETKSTNKRAVIRVAQITHRFAYQGEEGSVPMAQRTMHGVVAAREFDVTRRILCRGDRLRGGLMASRDWVPRDSRVQLGYLSMVRWPKVDLHQYLRSTDVYKLGHLGVDPMRGLERRGLVDEELEDVEAKDWWVPGEDTEDGQMGLVIEKKENGTRSLSWADIKARRFDKAPFTEPPDEFMEPLVDLTHLQTLARLQRQQGLRLSSQVARTLAREAVSKAVETFDRMAGLWLPGINTEYSKSKHTYKPYNLSVPANTLPTGWIGVLESALLASLPPEVVARAFYRLIRLCDVPSETDDWELLKKQRAWDLNQKYGRKVAQPYATVVR